jgi:DNA-binding MarR family transcriptional regulator
MSDKRAIQDGAPISVPAALGRLRVAMDAAYIETSRELGLTPQQAELLCAAMRPDTLGDLARALHREHSNVSRLVDRAASRGLLDRRAEETDGRLSVIELTPEGRQLAQRFIKTLASKTEPLTAGWSAKRQQTAVQTLIALAKTLEASTGHTASATEHSTRDTLAATQRRAG